MHADPIVYKSRYFTREQITALNNAGLPPSEIERIRRLFAAPAAKPAFSWWGWLHHIRACMHRAR